jgi:microcystin-dependent protein
MPSPYYYYVYPFGENADDLTAIPTTAAMDGSVSYFAGWTDPYEYNLLTNPAALPIPRGQMNQLFYDITNNLQQYQQYGTPIWVTGNTVQYPIYARVYYSGLVYENQVVNNTATPGVDATWTVVSGSLQGVPVGAVLDYASPLVPAGFLGCDGSAYSRTTYAALFQAITFTQTGVTINGDFTITGLASTANMYVGMIIECPNVGGAFIVSVDSGTQITLGAAATTSGSNLVRFYQWGNGDGGSTFNVPDLRRETTVGSGGTGTATLGNIVGQKGGAETHTLVSAELPDPAVSLAQNHQAATGTDFAAIASAGTYGSGVVSNQGGNQPHSIIQPSRVMFKMIKYV